ncbi:MAG: hypothetical protein U0414_33005 [Polyangiaceae bacterium]
MARVIWSALLASVPIASGWGPSAARAEDRTIQRIDAFGGLTIADSRGLPGQTQGTSFALGYGVEGGVRSVRGRHVFAGDFHVVEGLSFSLSNEVFFKSLDDARLRTSYAFTITPWLDFTAWADASAPMFGSFVREPEGTTFDVRRADGLHELHGGPTLALTQPFLPLRANETVGVALHPLRRPFLGIDVRAGIGVDHAVADGQLEVQDDASTADVEAIELESHHALVPALEVALAGELEERLGYGLDVAARVPLAYTDVALVAGRTIPELTMVRLRLSVSIQILPWLTTDYELVVDRNPFLSDGIGVANRLMLAAHPLARWATEAP